MDATEQLPATQAPTWEVADRLRVTRRRRLARMMAVLAAPDGRDLRDLAEIATEHCASLTAAVREAERDKKFTDEELDVVDAVAAGAEAEIAQVRARVASMRMREGR